MSLSMERTPLSASPWEPLGRSIDGRGGFSRFKSPTASQAVRAESPLSRSVLGSGLTRRGVIYEYVRAHPGAHVRRMAKELHLATGDLQYHLHWLESRGYVKTRKAGFYRFVFPTMVFRPDQEVLLAALAQETPREVILLLRDGALSQRDLAGRLGLSQPTVSWHMKRLTQLGLVGKSRGSGGVTYALAADREEVLRFVEAYHLEAWKRWSGRLSQTVASAEDVGSLRGARLMPPAVVERIAKR